MAAPNVAASAADLFDSYFRKADLDRDGRISGEEAVAFFQGSGLPKNVLAQIWMHADQNRIGFLGRAEFYNALRLVTVAQSKRDLTPDLVKAALYGPASSKIPPPQISMPVPPVTAPVAQGLATQGLATQGFSTTVPGISTKLDQHVSIPSNSTHATTGIPHRPAAPVSTPPQAPWQNITPSDVQKYTKVFLEVDKDRDGKITGLEARNLFLSWRLPREVLKQVWDLSDQDNDSMLSSKEFCIALYLMERYREGRPLPSVLPSNVISDFPTLSQPTAGFANASLAPTSGWQQPQGTSVPGARQVRPAAGGRPPLPIPIPQVEESETKQPKSKVPVLEKELANQLSKEEQEALNSKFREATEADKMVEELEKEILQAKEKIEFYRTKMQELVLYKSRCDNRLNEITERVSGDKREVDLLAKKYEEKCKQLGDVASKLTMEEATFRDVQEKKMELYQAIVKMEQDGTADGILQERADHVQSDLDELLKSLNDRCKKYGLRAKPTALVELPFGWQPGIQEEAADWDEEWDKFEDEGFTFVKELTLDVQNVIAPPRPKSILTRKEKVSTVESLTASSSSNGDVKLEKSPSIVERPHENGSPVAAPAVESPSREFSETHFSKTAAATAVDSPSREFSESHFSKTNSDYDASPRSKVSESDHGVADSLVSEDKVFDEKPWGTFENDDLDSVWGFNPVSTSKDSDHARQTNDYFFGSDEFNINPIRTESPGGAGGFNQNRSTFFDDSVPSTPQYTSGYSPRYSLGSESSFHHFSRFDSFSSSTQDTSSFFQPREPFSRFDSMRSNNDFDLGRETFSRFDSMKSTKDFDKGQGSYSFDDSDPFGSSGPFKTNTSTENQTPRRGSDNWSAF